MGALIFWLAMVAFVIVTTLLSRERRRRRLVSYAAAPELRTTNIDGHERSSGPIAGWTAVTAAQRIHPF